MRTVAAILTLALAASASASVVVVRQGAAQTADIGTKPYERIAQSPNSNCPERITHGIVDPRPTGSTFNGFGIEGSINFSQITAGAQCRGRNESAAMVLLSQDELGRFARDQANFLQLSDAAWKKVFLAAIDTQVRRCGGFVASDLSYYAFTKEIEVFRSRLESLGVVINRNMRVSGEKWMISYIPQQNSICAYIDQLAPSFMRANSTTVPDENITPTNVTETPEPSLPSVETESTPSPSPSVSGTSPGNGNNTDSDRVCFPGSATVELEDGSFKKMWQVEIGDKVKIADGVFSDVFMFTHKMENVIYDFVNVKTTSGAELALTAGHYLYVNGGLAAAKTVRAGDVVESASGELLTVASVGVKTMTGLYNPQTVQGDIIVNGIRASTYTTAVQPNAAHALLAPLRGLYARLGFATTALDHGSDFLANQAPTGAAVVA